MTLFSIALAAAAVQAAEPLPSVSSPMNDYNLSVAADDRLLVFARSEADFRKARILIAEKTGSGWGVPEPIGFSDDRYDDSDPWLTPDGRTLYFVSNRPAPGRGDGRTDYDIWRSARMASGWSPPEHLGPQVNSAGQELGPELHGDALYFSSTRRGGRGGLDIYRAQVNGSDFLAPTPLEEPINSAGSESDFTLSADGSAAMFWRSVGERGIIHISHRTANGWSAPVPLPVDINKGPFNYTPSFSGDGRRIRFASTLEREGQPSGLADIFEAPLPR